MNLYALNPPRHWRAGWTGDGESRKPFHHNCDGCGAKEPVIRGFLADAAPANNAAQYADIALVPSKTTVRTTVRSEDGSERIEDVPIPTLALYCRECFRKFNEQLDKEKRVKA